MKVYKRDGKEVDFCLDKIESAIDKANRSTFKKFFDDIKNDKEIYQSPDDFIFDYETILYITNDNFDWENPNSWNSENLKKPAIDSKEKFIKGFSKYILVDGNLKKVVETTQKFLKPFDTVTVEDISDLAEKSLMKNNAYEVAKEFITYRDNKKKTKKFTETEEKIISVIDGTNEQLRGDNANKRIDVNSAARDYIAGVECKDIARKILPKEIVKAHDKKIIHFHDMDYSPVMNETNCCVYDLEDMLDNGFCMNEVGIKTPKRFSTAANLAAQTNLIVSSLQYGGQTFTWNALSKYVEKTRIDIAKKLKEEFLSNV